MRSFGLWLFILSLPLIAALGHDGYMAYNNPHGIDLSKQLPFSDLGWVWQRRAYDSWRFAHDAVDPALWQKLIKPVLDQKTVIVAAMLPATFIMVVLVFKLLGIGPYAGQGLLGRRSFGRGKFNDGGRTAPAPKMRYKRR